MKTAIFSLYMRHELAKARCFIAQVAPVLSDRRVLHILINDQDCPELRKYAQSASRHIAVHCEGKNLGVAGGRNWLVRHAIEAGAEFFISCDTDIIYESSYFDNLEGAYFGLAERDPKVGFLQPVLLNGREVVKDVMQLQVGNWDELLHGLRSDRRWLSTLWRTVQASRGKAGAITTIWHSGVSNPWRAHFGNAPDQTNTNPWEGSAWVGQLLTAKSTLRHEPLQLELLVEEGAPVRVASTAGGVSAFHVDTYLTLGGYDEIFNPFGYEDSEIGFRSMVAGYHNYLVTNTFAIHDIFMGESNRSALSHSRIGLLRGVEAMHPALSAAEYQYAVGQSLVFGWRDLLKPLGDAVAAGRLEKTDLEQAFGSFLISYGLDFVRGALHTLAGHAAQAGESALKTLLRGLLTGDAETETFEIPIGYGAKFVAGHAMTRKRPDANGRLIYSLFASNCRIEESGDAETLTSKYFDFALVASPGARDSYSVSFDVQSDDCMFNNELTVELAADADIGGGSVKVRGHERFSKHYEYGKFSVEDIYPQPTLHRSQNWVRFALSTVQTIASAARDPAVSRAVEAISRYCALGSQPTETVHTDTLRRPVTHARKKRVLVFTDSRGQHKPAGGEYPIFGERLAADERFSVDLFLCPMKWTTTLDFLESFDREKLTGYDHIVLYTGIVDWSPRRLSSAVSDLYHNTSVTNVDNLGLNTRDYSKKIVNDKREIFDNVFGAPSMATHFSRPWDVEYEDEKTINMYGLEMAKDKLIPRLNDIPNLIFITSNRFVDGWNGDYRRQRPANMAVTHAYSELFSRNLAGVKVIDLMTWSDDEVKKYTCDNLHLTQLGSDHIYERIIAEIVMAVESTKARLPAKDAEKSLLPGIAVAPANTPARSQDTKQIDANLAKKFMGVRAPERITAAKKNGILLAAKRTGYLATLVIGVRLDSTDTVRLKNLRFLLAWLDFYYGDLFDVLLVEQDVSPKLDLEALSAEKYVRSEFIFNPREYNRGWGYNVAISHFCGNSDVVVLMDTDVLTGANFVREVIDCHSKYDAISPYQNIYYTDAREAAEVISTKRLDGLNDPRKIKNPVTVAGGILIVRRDIYVALQGFEQYVGYGCEDRAFDVTLLNHVDKARVRIAGETYAHLHHLADQSARVRFEEIYDHLVTNYGCMHDPSLGPYDFIHQNCRHANKEATLRRLIERAESFGDPDLYRKPGELTVNGISRRIAMARQDIEVIYPPEMNSLEEYEQKELYANTPQPDSAELAVFHNAFKGKRCFIIGNGPSLNKHDLSLLQGEYTFGVNSFYYKTRETGFKPFFYVVEDSSVMKENIEEIRKFDAPFKFFPTNYKNLHPKQPNTFFFRMNRGFYEKSSPNYVIPRFSTDASKVLYCGQSVTYINLQLAHFMGFTEVYLIGMDFSYVIPETHKRSGDVLLSDTDDENHFHKDYFGRGKTWKDPKLDRVALNYRMAKLAYEATGRRIFNATVGGNLELFERADYQSLLKPRASVAPGVPVALTEANRLYRERNFAKALGAYIELARGEGALFMHKRSAVDSFMRAVEAGQTCKQSDAEFARSLISNL